MMESRSPGLDPLFFDQVFERLLSRASTVHAESKQQSQRKSWQKSLSAAIEQEMGHSQMIQLVEQLTQQVNARLEVAFQETPTQKTCETFSKAFLKTLEERLRFHIESSIKRALRSVPNIWTTPLSWPGPQTTRNQPELYGSFATGFMQSVGARPRFRIASLTQEALQQSMRYSIAKAYESVARETARQTVDSTVETNETQPVENLHDTESHDFEPLVEDMWNYASRSHRDKEPLIFLSFEELHRLNIMHQGIHLQEKKTEFRNKGPWWSGAEMDALAGDLEKYTNAIRNYEYISSKKAIIGGVESISPDGLAKMNTLRKCFKEEFGYDLGHDSSDWKSMDDDRSNRKDSSIRRLLVRLVGKILPVRVTYTEAERRQRWIDFVSKRPPKEVSFFVDSLVRFILALCGGALIIVPIIIMVLFPRIWPCLTVTGVSVLIFAVVVGFSQQTSNIAALGVTATYAAVLVVFLGLSMESQGGGI